MGKELRTLNEQNKMVLWAGHITECRNSGQGVKVWCREHGICEATYYKWQKRLYEMAQAQQSATFVDVTPRQKPPANIAVTVQLDGAAVQVHNGADAATVETVLRLLKSC